MSEKNKKSGIVFAAWTVGALIVLIAFLVNGNKIISNLKTTDFFERVFGKGTTPEFVKNHKDEKPKSNGLLEVEVEGELKEPSYSQNPNPDLQNTDNSSKPETTNPTIHDLINSQNQISASDNTVKNEAENQTIADSSKNQNNSENNKEKAVEPSVAAPVVTPPPAPKPINLHVYYVIIDSDGSITRKEASRSSTRRDAPLTASIELLLAGPTVQERNSNYMTLIPSGTRLINAYIKNGVAVLNFSEAFEYNTYGVEGYLGQLMQIVYTATSFSTVESVQFLIEGQKKDYLGSEGVWIGSPLARSSFK